MNKANVLLLVVLLTFTQIAYSQSISKLEKSNIFLDKYYKSRFDTSIINSYIKSNIKFHYLKESLRYKYRDSVALLLAYEYTDFYPKQTIKTISFLNTHRHVVDTTHIQSYLQLRGAYEVLGKPRQEYKLLKKVLRAYENPIHYYTNNEKNSSFDTSRLDQSGMLKTDKKRILFTIEKQRQKAKTTKAYIEKTKKCNFCGEWLLWDNFLARNMGYPKGALKLLNVVNKADSSSEVRAINLSHFLTICRMTEHFKLGFKISKILYKQLPLLKSEIAEKEVIYGIYMLITTDALVRHNFNPKIINQFQELGFDDVKKTVDKYLSK